jgi:hypothetical protein
VFAGPLEVALEVGEFEGTALFVGQWFPDIRDRRVPGDAIGADGADRRLGIPRPDVVFEQRYTTDGDNTGLGLAIVRRIAEGHGWEIDVAESESGGARFGIRTA